MTDTTNYENLMENRKEEMKSIIKKYPMTYKITYYDKMTEKLKLELLKKYDVQLNINEIVAFMDETVFASKGNGVIFTLRGIYEKEILAPIYYINYADMKFISEIKHDTSKNKKLVDIQLEDGQRIKYDTLAYSSYDFSSMLLELRKLYKKWGDLESFKESGKIEPIKLSMGEAIKCNSIIHAAAASTAPFGFGLAQIPLSDTAVITPIQIGMITGIAGVFNIHIGKGAARAILGGCAAAFVGRGAAQLAVGWIPVAGNIVNAATAVAITEAVGWIAVKHFFDMSQSDEIKFKAGYFEAAEEYEAKFGKQAREFAMQKKKYEELNEKEREEYDNYHDKLENYIKELESNKNLSKDMSNLLSTATTDFNILSSKFIKEK